MGVRKQPPRGGGSLDSRQHKFSKTNLKAMKVALEQSQKEASQVDLDAINKRK